MGEGVKPPSTSMHECTRTDLGQENAPVIGESYLELETGDIALLIFCVSESHRLDNLFFHRIPPLNHQADS